MTKNILLLALLSACASAPADSTDAIRVHISTRMADGTVRTTSLVQTSPDTLAGEVVTTSPEGRTETTTTEAPLSAAAFLATVHSDASGASYLETPEGRLELSEYNAREGFRFARFNIDGAEVEYTVEGEVPHWLAPAAFVVGMALVAYCTAQIRSLIDYCAARDGYWEWGIGGFGKICNGRCSSLRPGTP